MLRGSVRALQRRLDSVTVLAGVDLSWSGRKPTGLCVVCGDGEGWSLARLECVPNADAEDIARLLNSLGRDVIAAVDAPLIAGPNRHAEADLARMFGRQGVYAYAARPDFLHRHGIAEGPRLGGLLRGHGWSLGGPGWIERPLALEVFPHATAVSLLGAARALRYKRGPLAGRIEQLAELQGVVRAYAERHLPCLFSDPAETLTAPPRETSGRALKDLENRLDAVVCVVAAHHAYRFGPDGFFVFGDTTDGYIAVPRAVEPTSVLAPSSP